MALRAKTLYNRPLVNFSRSTPERLILVCICALLAIGQSAITDRGASLIVALSALFGAVAAELCLNYARRKPGLHDCSSFATALILALLMPNTINPLIAGAAAVFAIAVVKGSFGGFGLNWLNPAIGGWLFARFSWGGAFNQAMENSPFTFLSNLIKANTISFDSSPLSILNANGFGVRNGNRITSFLNDTVFSVFNIELPVNYFDFFINPGTGIIADRGVFGLLLGCAVLIAAKANRFVLSVIYLAVYLFLLRFAGVFTGVGVWGFSDMLFCLLSGSTLTAAFLLVVEPVSAPKSVAGRIVAVVLAASLSFLFRYTKMEIFGAVLAVACINTVTPFIRLIEERFFYESSYFKKWRLVISISRSVR
ncbi:MAG: RnfABCDGE type electron transport complex subunit D [Spirochaetaceae bacterium]|jgi:electron transport complex protein RnfD|nr:RnfABCDGE type electron transport complex subunit D [Spirochaetaceae bacterium]